MSDVVPFRGREPARRFRFFDRRELKSLLDVYARMVALGEWRDYGFEVGDDSAAFLVYRRAAELPLYRIIKRFRPRRRQEIWQVVAPGRIVRRGEELGGVLAFFDKRLFAVVGGE